MNTLHIQNWLEIYLHLSCLSLMSAIKSNHMAVNNSKKKKKVKKEKLSWYFSILLGAIFDGQSIICSQYIIFSRSDMGARSNSRESRKASKGTRSCIRAHDHDRRFPLSCSASTFVQSRCYASCLCRQLALVPSQCTDEVFRWTHTWLRSAQSRR